jgi:hypothetical protein
VLCGFLFQLVHWFYRFFLLRLSNSIVAQSAALAVPCLECDGHNWAGTAPCTFLYRIFDFENLTLR